MENNEKDKIEEIIEALMIKAFFEKFTRDKKVYIKGMYEFLRKKVGLVWLKEKPFYSKARKIYERLHSKYRRVKRHKKMTKLQNKYKNLRIYEAYSYLEMKGKFKLVNEDIETFEEVLEILFANLKKK